MAGPREALLWCPGCTQRQRRGLEQRAHRATLRGAVRLRGRPHKQPWTGSTHAGTHLRAGVGLPPAERKLPAPGLHSPDPTGICASLPPPCPPVLPHTPPSLPQTPPIQTAQVSQALTPPTGLLITDPPPWASSGLAGGLAPELRQGPGTSWFHQSDCRSGGHPVCTCSRLLSLLPGLFPAGVPAGRAGRCRSHSPSGGQAAGHPPC